MALQKLRPIVGHSLLWAVGIGIIIVGIIFNIQQRLKMDKITSSQRVANAITSISYELPGRWHGAVGNKAASLLITKSNGQLSGKLFYDSVEENLSISFRKGEKDSISLVLQGIDYTRLKGKGRFSLDTFNGIIKSGGLLEGNYSDTAGHSGHWSFKKAIPASGSEETASPEPRQTTTPNDARTESQIRERELEVSRQAAARKDSDGSIVHVDRSAKPDYSHIGIQNRGIALLDPELENTGPTQFDVTKLYKHIDPNERRVVYEHLKTSGMLTRCLNLQDLKAIKVRGLEFFHKHFGNRHGKGGLLFAWKSIVEVDAVPFMTWPQLGDQRKSKNTILMIPYLSADNNSLTLGWAERDIGSAYYDQNTPIFLVDK